MGQIADAYRRILDDIAEESIKQNRKFDDIKLICVSKMVGFKEILEVKNAGGTDFGENRILELAEKQSKIPDVNWHMIGHIQKNKVKHLSNVSLIHSLDSLELAKELNDRAKKLNTKFDALLEVKVSDETTKTGIKKADIEETINGLYIFENLNICGMMAIAPYGTDNNTAQPYFAQVRELYEKYSRIKTENIAFKYLSMGMTNDFRAAIAQGANILRIGSAIFGAGK